MRRRFCARALPCGQLGTLAQHPTDHVFEGRERLELQVFVTLYVIRFAHGGKCLRLLDRIYAQIRFQIQFYIQHVWRITGLLAHNLQHLGRHRIQRRLRLTVLSRVDGRLGDIACGRRNWRGHRALVRRRPILGRPRPLRGQRRGRRRMHGRNDRRGRTRRRRCSHSR